MKRKFKTWKLLLPVLVSGLIVGVWWLKSMGGDGSLMAADSGAVDHQVSEGSPGGKGIPVRVLRLGTLPPPLREDDYRGTIEPSKASELSFRRSGLLMKLTVSEGESVSAGDCLAELNAGDIEAQLRGTESQIAEAEAVLAEMIAGPRRETIKAAEAELQESKAAMELANLTLERERRLQSSSASSEQAFDEAKAAADRSAASFQAARERLNELEAGTRSEQLVAQRARVASLNSMRDVLKVQLDDCRIIAPFDGVIARRYVDEGIIAGPDRPIFRLLQVDPLEARFGVSAEDAENLKAGDNVMVTVAGEPVEAVVTRIEPDLELETRTRGVFVSIENQGNSRRVVPGQMASMSVPRSATESSDRFWVPIQALSRSVRGLWSVFMVVDDSDGNFRVERLDVQVLETEAGMALIAGGMVRSDLLIVSEGLHRVTPGIRVDPVFKTHVGVDDAGRR